MKDLKTNTRHIGLIWAVVAALLLLALGCPGEVQGGSYKNLLKKMPVPLETLTKYGCVVSGFSDDTYQLRIWGEHKSLRQVLPVRDWKIYVGQYKDEMKALKDCHKWKKRVKKQVRKVQVKK